MAQLETRLRDFLEPLRDHGVGALLQAYAEALGRGGEVEAEPLVRDGFGQIRRQGPLELPARGDIAVTRDGRRLVHRIEGDGLESFEPITLVADGGFTTVLAPFAWERAPMLVESRQPRPDWGALRRWYLEWFQPRMADVGPDFGGVLHRLDGPRETPAGWALEVDFGTAPSAAVVGLMGAMAQSGALRLRIGHGG
ncbi:hypothetical protein LNKW23_41310 [Paralimibaculum aggregatum]|uniref:Uncharacterized protein n=1 Tax=Paralimibaculum aggregatum TaxID=3036245 RepID=A0ABQ6LNV9_9RHOB|nr:hypothetical protein [Limibaculum sp. NKW23]GMG84915.1 hypothetical protein LNKW23_41310 [Limibaculum sp. NKW23]